MTRRLEDEPDPRKRVPHCVECLRAMNSWGKTCIDCLLNPPTLRQAG